MSSAMTTRSTRRSLRNKKGAALLSEFAFANSFGESLWILPGAVPVGNCHAQKQGRLHNIIV